MHGHERPTRAIPRDRKRSPLKRASCPLGVRASLPTSTRSDSCRLHRQAASLPPPKLPASEHAGHTATRSPARPQRCRPTGPPAPPGVRASLPSCSIGFMLASCAPKLHPCRPPKLLVSRHARPRAAHPRTRSIATMPPAGPRPPGVRASLPSLARSDSCRLHRQDAFLPPLQLPACGHPRPRASTRVPTRPQRCRPTGPPAPWRAGVPAILLDRIPASHPRRQAASLPPPRAPGQQASQPRAAYQRPRPTAPQAMKNPIDRLLNALSQTIKK